MAVDVPLVDGPLADGQTIEVAASASWATDALSAISDGHDHEPPTEDFYRPEQRTQSSTLRFLTEPSLAEPIEIGLDYLRQNAAQFGLQASDLDEFRISDQYTSQHTGVTHLYLRQQYRGLDVLHADISLHVTPRGEVVTVSSSFLTGLDIALAPLPTGGPHIPQSAPVVEPVQSLLALAEHMNWPTDQIAPENDNPSLAPASSKSASVGTSVGHSYDVYPGGGGLNAVLPTSGVSINPIPVELRYVPRPYGGVELAWGMIIETTDGQHWYDASVSAEDGSLLSMSDWAHNATYNVFATPSESPNDGARVIVSEVADETASPLGWHDTDSRDGVGESTTTRGNNVIAQEDVLGFDRGGFSPDGGESLTFDFPFDTSNPPSENESAAITNLFYQLNVLHDIHYRYGFDEAAGNFQQTNLSGDGEGGDAIYADARDGGEANNAAFYVAPDGVAPRIQMGEWEAQTYLSVYSPEDLEGEFAAAGASFGPPLAAEPLVGAVVASIPRDGCSPIVNASAISGNIALIERGDCYFTEKVNQAGEAGATGVIITNNEPSGLVFMGGDDTTAIPALMITLDDGNQLRTALDLGSEVRVGLRGGQPLDSSFDNGVIIHEFGHGVSTRLVGGPSNANSLDSTQGGGLGEGWSDWWALMLTQTEDDSQSDAYPIGTYLVGQPADGDGIRRFSYSYDMSVNPLTFEDLDDARADVSCRGVGCAQVHNAGEVWASALWDFNWLLINGDGASIPARGFDPDFYDGTGGNNLALQLVIDGMKLLPANPTFIEARDAILSADLALTGGENLFAIWSAFARRGMGASASATDDGFASITVNEAFDIPDLSGNAHWWGDSANGQVGDGVLWTDPNNWRTNGFFDRLPSTLPPGDDVLLKQTAGGGTTIDLNGDQIANSLTFESSYNLVGGELAISSGGIKVDQDAIGTILGPIKSAQPIDKSGDGTLVLGGNSDEVIVTEGTLIVASTSTVGNINLTNGATLIQNGTVTGSVTGGGSAIAAGDFNRDGNVTSADIDALYARIASGDFDPAYDLVADGVLDDADIADLVIARLGTNYGDANLDGNVDAADFNAWQANRFRTDTTWSSGDFNGDGVTDGSDFNLWYANRFTRMSSPSARRISPRSP